MTSSGTYNASLTNGEAMIDAYRRIGIHKPQLTADQMGAATRELMLLLNVEWSNRGVNLWTVVLNSVSLVQGTATYVLPANVIMVLDAYRSTTTGGVQTDIFMTPVSRDDYAAYPQKSIQAPPTLYYFDRQITPQITLFPVPDSGGPYTLNYYACTQIQDISLASGQTPGIPVRWYDAMVAGLSYRLSRIYAPTVEPQRKADYAEAWQFAADQDIQNTPVRIAPRSTGYWPY